MHLVEFLLMIHLRPIIMFQLNLIYLVFVWRIFHTRMILMICESQGQPYPITNTTKNKIFPSAFVDLSNFVWHGRLGHPKARVLEPLKKWSDWLNSIFKKNFILVFLVNMCKITFIDSHNSVVMSFDILHTHVWISHEYFQLQILCALFEWLFELFVDFLNFTQISSFFNFW